MKFSWFKALIIVSLGLNCMIAGAVVYRYFWAGTFGRPHGPGQFLGETSLQNQAAHAAVREKMAASRENIHSARTRIIESVGTQTPDRTLISKELDTINKLQSDMERMAVEQMLQDVQALPPEKRDAFLADLQRSMFCRMGEGPGMVRGRDDHGRHWPKNSPP